jgi:hypothetical protein
VNALFDYFVDLCLLRRGPQDLPASGTVLALCFGANILVGTLLIVGADMGLALSLLESLAEAALVLGVLWLILAGRGLRARFLQTASATLGAAALLGMVALPLLGLAGSGRTTLAEFGGLLLLFLVIWNVVVLGHILRHALDLTLGQGVGLAILYTLGSYAVLNGLFPLG